MLNDAEDETIKVIIVGDGFTGKTTLLRRFARGDFSDQYKRTVGAEFLEKDVFLRDSGITVKLMLWDTAGQEAFHALTQAYYRGAGVAILVFSTVDRDSFFHVGSWKGRVEAACGPITMVLCQSKFDLSHDAAVTNAEAEELAKQLKIPLFRVSSKDDFNVTQMFEFAAQQCLNASDEAGGDDDEETPTAPSVPLREEPESALIPCATAASSTAPQEPVASGGAGDKASDESRELKDTSRFPALLLTASSPSFPSVKPPQHATTAAASDGDNAKKRCSRKDERSERRVSLDEPAVAASGKRASRKKKCCTLL